MVLTQSINIAHFTVTGSQKQLAAPVLLKHVFIYVGLAGRNCLKIRRQVGAVAGCIVGAGFMPARLRLIRPRAGMKPAPTKHHATNVVRLRILRQFRPAPLQQESFQMPLIHSFQSTFAHRKPNGNGMRTIRETAL